MSEQFTCKTCVMDKTAEEIVFTETGCNFCDTARKSLADTIQERPKLFQFLSQIKHDSKDYDCLIGLSGGVDSSFTLHKAIELGLKPLCFSVDNGWQDEKAQENIMKLVEGLKVPYFRYNLDREKFVELQNAFIKAGQKNLEIPTDHILMAVTYLVASTYGIKWILSGGNTATESIMPPSWGYNARDLVHINSVYEYITDKKLTGLPTCSLLKFNYYKWIKGIKTFYLLDYLDYNRDEAVKILNAEYGFQDYQEKHCESIFTWWFQNFYLYEKFGIDKRKAHLSSLIVSGQMTRDKALELLTENPVYPTIGIEKKALTYQPRPYTDFKTDEKLFNLISKVIRKCRF